MIDLSNNNGPIAARRLYAAGQRRAYLKLSEGNYFHDGDHAGYRRELMAAGLKVGEYHFARPSRCTPREEADYFLRLLPKLVPGRSLFPCLDLEDPACKPSQRIAAWAESFVALVKRELGRPVVLYGSSSYLEACGFKYPTGPLWLASYGRNDGREYPFATPKPWTHVAAHQYASTATVAGVAGKVDLSHVFKPRELDVPKPLGARVYGAVRVVAGRLIPA